MKKNIIFSIFILLANAIYSAPAERIRKTFLLIDGTSVEATFTGDEFGAFYQTSSGDVVLKTDSGYVLATAQQKNDMIVDISTRRNSRKRVGSIETAPLKPIGKKYVPVVLVSFADKDFSVSSTQDGVRAYYELYCNGSRDGNLYTGHGSKGSIKDYFLQQSSGLFEPEFIPIGPVKLDNVYAYYGADRYNSNGSIASYDANFSLFRNEAISKALNQHSDWSIFDNDGNGSVDMVFFIYAGLGQNSGGDDNTIWPKESTSGITLAGQYFATSAACCECRPAQKDAHGNVTATKADGIGVFIHELSHALGLPDFYDTRNVAFGMDMWSVMDYGEYCNNGYNPANYTAYERHFMGWENLPEINAPATIRLKCFAEGGGGVKVVNDSNPDEYYILENRQAKGWDDYLGRICTGLQVTHVDYSSAAWNQNRVNTDPSHQRMTIIAANNCYKGSNSASSSAEYLSTLRGNLFPGSEGVNCLTDDTTPASVVYTGGFMGKPLYDIKEQEDATISFKFSPLGTLPSPDSLLVSNITANSFKVAWRNVRNAEAYRLKLIADGEVVWLSDSLRVSEFTFNDFYSSASLVFAVQAISDFYRDGDWSESAPFNLPTDILSPSQTTSVSFELYDLYGVYLGSFTNESLSTLKNGVYVMKLHTGDVKKIYIR